MNKCEYHANLRNMICVKKIISIGSVVPASPPACRLPAGRQGRQSRQGRQAAIEPRV